MARRNYRLTWSDEKQQWQVRLEGASRASRLFDKKNQALRWGKRRAKEKDTSLEIFTKDGRHQETDTYATTEKESTNKY